MESKVYIGNKDFLGIFGETRSNGPEKVGFRQAGLLVDHSLPDLSLMPVLSRAQRSNYMKNQKTEKSSNFAIFSF